MDDADDHELKYRALTMWANWIETGIVTMSAQDVIQAGMSNKIKGLDPSQQRFVVRLRDLATEELKLSHQSSRR